MTIARLRYFGQLIVSGQPMIWALLQRDKLWIPKLFEDLDCLGSYCPEIGSFVSLQQNWQSLADFVTVSPARRKRILRKLQARSISVHKIDVEWAQWHQNIRDKFVKYQIVPPENRMDCISAFCCFCYRKTFSKLYRHRPQITLQEKDSMARAGDKLGRYRAQSREKDGKGKQDLNHLITASASKAGKKMTRRQRQPRAKSGTETSLGTTAAAAAKSEIMKGDKLGRPGGSGSQERSYKGRQV